MNFSNIRFIDAGINGDGLTPSALKDIPTYVDDCVYIFRRYPSIARTSTMISPSNMVESQK